MMLFNEGLDAVAIEVNSRACASQCFCVGTRAPRGEPRQVQGIDIICRGQDIYRVCKAQYAAPCTVYN
eukprot:1142640-Pelagomonas_calceolata.AAC.2